MSVLRDLWNLGLSFIRPYSPMSNAPDDIDRQYRRGEWDYLRGTPELPRFSIVAGYANHFKPGGSILELGCGEGILFERLCVNGHSRYVGVDFSSEAIVRARDLSSQAGAFVVADAALYEPEGQFDVIVFNECLEYFERPRDAVARYRRFLSPGGLFIVSMFVGVDSRRASMIWKMLEKDHAVDATARVTTSRRLSWNIKVLRPSRSES